MEISVQTRAVGSQAAGDIVSPSERRNKGQRVVGAEGGFHRGSHEQQIREGAGGEAEEEEGRVPGSTGLGASSAG